MTRIDYSKVAPEGVKVVRAVDRYVRASELEAALVELVKVRASLMNGCAYCVDLHTKEARAKGETEQRRRAVTFRPAIGSHKPAGATTAASI